VTAPRLSTATLLHLRGAEAPEVRTFWDGDDILGVSWQGATAVQYLGLVGTPHEVRLALASGLAAIDRAVAGRTAEAGRCARCGGLAYAAGSDGCRCQPTEPKPLYPELGDDLKRAGEQAARHRAGQP